LQPNKGIEGDRQSGTPFERRFLIEAMMADPIFSFKRRGDIKPVMRNVLFALIAILIGYGLTLVFYMVGQPLVAPSLFLARLLAQDRGGDSLLPAFMIINTLICAVVIYCLLRSVSKYRHCWDKDPTKL
jgi:hypothetical protein